jgi:hypothetical protein
MYHNPSSRGIGVEHSDDIFPINMSYFLTVRCDGPSVILRIDQGKMEKILADDIDNGCLFFKQPSSAIGNRLMTLYTQLA